jgi:hypothetical protein
VVISALLFVWLEVLSFLNANPETLVKNTKKIIDTISYLSIWKAIEIQSPEKINAK